MGVLAGGRAVHLWVGPGPARRRRGGTATVWAAAAVAGLRPARCCRRPGVTASRTIESQKESSAPRRAIDGGATPSSRPVAGWLRWRSQCPHHRADIGCRAASAGPTGGVRRTGSRLRGCGCRGCPNACRAVRRLSASRCPVSGVRCPVSARPVAGVPGCPLWGVRVRASRVRASRVRVRPVRAGGVLWSASVRGGPTVWDGRLCRGRPPVSASGRSSAQVRRDWSGGGCAGPSGDGGRDLAAVLGCARAAAAATFDRLPTRTAGWRRGSPVGWLKDHGGGAVRATFAHVLDGYAGRQGQDYGHEARP
jgi:hypothetical protein